MNSSSFPVSRFCRLTGMILALFSMAMIADGNLSAQDKDESAVKLTASAGKIGTDGKQTITIKMKVDDGWHAYANEVDNVDLESNKTSISIAGPKKLDIVTIDYPKGLKQKSGNDTFYVYEGSVDILATVKRTLNDTSPLEVTVKFVTCHDKKGICKPPETVKLQVK